MKVSVVLVVMVVVVVGFVDSVCGEEKELGAVEVRSPSSNNTYLIASSLSFDVTFSLEEVTISLSILLVTI